MPGSSICLCSWLSCDVKRIASSRVPASTQHNTTHGQQQLSSWLVVQFTRGWEACMPSDSNEMRIWRQQTLYAPSIEHSQCVTYSGSRSPVAWSRCTPACRRCSARSASASAPASPSCWLFTRQKVHVSHVFTESSRGWTNAKRRPSGGTGKTAVHMVGHGGVWSYRLRCRWCSSSWCRRPRTAAAGDTETGSSKKLSASAWVVEGGRSMLQPSLNCGAVMLWVTHLRRKWMNG